MQSQGASFRDAVAQLAAEAGLEVPAPTPEAAAAERRRHDLHGVLAAAAASYRRRLHAPEGRAALDYLCRRGLTDETIERFGLGWSGEGRGALAAELAREDVPPAMLAEAGLTRDDGGRFTDLFFNRVMFPIRDRGGRIISFGGRTLGDGQPKYVNGPETALFAKRRTLYGADLAREALRQGARLVVVEGYMDVIALHQAGFGGAVAPLGTALTEEQLTELWRMHPVPVLCFDGDDAGARATARSSELALQKLDKADRSIRIILLPNKQDPDTYLKEGSAKGFQILLEEAASLLDTVFSLSKSRFNLRSPEQRAMFRNYLERGR